LRALHFKFASFDDAINAGSHEVEAMKSKAKPRNLHTRSWVQKDSAGRKVRYANSQWPTFKK